MTERIFKNLDGGGRSSLLNFRINPVSNDPANPVTGTLWFNTTEGVLKYRTGNTTVTLRQDIKYDNSFPPSPFEGELLILTENVTTLPPGVSVVDANSNPVTSLLAGAVLRYSRTSWLHVLQIRLGSEPPDATITRAKLSIALQALIAKIIPYDSVTLTGRTLSFPNEGDNNQTDIDIPGITAKENNIVVGNANGITEFDFVGATVTHDGARAIINTAGGGTVLAMAEASFDSQFPLSIQALGMAITLGDDAESDAKSKTFDDNRATNVVAGATLAANQYSILTCLLYTSPSPRD